MDSARWERIQVIFHEALELPVGDRAAFVSRQCDGDATLESDVHDALAEDERGNSLLDGGVAGIVDQILGGPAAVVAQIGPYRLVRTIGEGGMGTVFLAERTDLGTRAAIKIVRDAWLSPLRRERFASEQRTLAALNHPSIARLYDAGTLSNGTPWIVMEYVDGVPVTDYCRARSLPIADRLRLFLDVCAAVQYAHGHLVVHRDLKPSNILVTDDRRVKLLDFGIAKQLDAGDGAIDQTRGGFALTPAYAAPEQIRGDRVGVRTDVYSVGVVLYELVSGRRPFNTEGRTAPDVTRAVLEEEPLPPSGSRKGTDLDVLCLTAMHRDPARRYQTVDALRRDIEHFLRGEPLEARPDSVRYRAAKFVGRNWQSLAVAAAVVLAVVGVVAFYTVRLAVARNAALIEATRAERIQGLMLNLFNGGDVTAGPAADLRVLTIIDRGVQEADALRDEPSVQTEMYATLGGIYQKLGAFGKADTLLQRTLTRRRTESGADSPEAGEALIALGLLRTDEAKYDEAESFVRDGLAAIAAAATPGDVRLERATTALGQVLVERGRYRDAISVLEGAVRLHGDRPADGDQATSLRQLASAHFYAGDYDRADTLFRRVLAISREVNGPRHPIVAEDLINVGAVQFEKGRYPQAEQLYREALTVTEAWYGPSHHQTASNLTMLGRALVYEKHFDEAVTVLQRALAIQERVFGPDHPRVASVVNDLGNVAVLQERYTDAEAAFTRMGAIYRAVYGGRHYLVATANSNLAGVHLAEKDYAGAEALYRDAIAMYAETLSPTHLNTGIARLKLGRTLLRSGRYAEAEKELLAGYGILDGQTSPSASWLQAARQDLATLYTATGRPDRAAAYVQN